MIRVVFAATGDRQEGVRASLKGLALNPARGKEVLIKPNFNTADSCPGSTHNDTLVALVDELWEMGARSISLGERSYLPTRQVMEQKGVTSLMKERGVKIVDFDDLGEKDWVEFKPNHSHWNNGFRIARPVLETECLISTCCLKTHQFGGIFTMSLKLHVGVVPTIRHGFEYMTELHRSSHQQKMIAEINEPFSPELVIMDAIDVFVDGGPSHGERAKGNVVLASTDRVAVDAAGLAILKVLGSNASIMKPKIFEQEQIARGVELELGVSSASEIDMVAADPGGQEYCDRVVKTLAEG
ncbi:MAG: DUF362 domain-containing protein [Deltaproteobacteria bacterium]|nr:DUF362 domain-containing protein [Deltaproteobacteria bacterium]